MPAALLVWGGESLVLRSPVGAIDSFDGAWVDRLGPGERPARRPAAETVPLERALRALPAATEVGCEDPGLVRALENLGVRARLAPVEEVRQLKERLPQVPVSTWRRLALSRARADLERTLAAPLEVLQSLAREDERVERAVGREAAAGEQLLPGASDALLRFVASSEVLRGAYARHQTVLRNELTSVADRVVPNLTALLGAPLAARLVLAADGLDALARMSGARLQLLGARRRPSPVRGPRFGFIYRAPRMEDVPPGRRGAYARSLAALAVIAARADAFTHRSISTDLLARRDRRVRELARRR